MISIRSHTLAAGLAIVVLAGAVPQAAHAAVARASTSTVAQATPAPKGDALHGKQAHRSLIVTGRVRYYNFARSYQTGTTDTSATSVGIKLHVETPSHNGLGIGATYYSASPFADDDIVPSQLETSLPGTKLNTLAEAYAQYSSTQTQTLVRAGRQTLTTPWANAADSREIPVTFEGIGGTQAISQDWSLTAYRIFRVKNRTSATFTDTTFVSTGATSGFETVGATRKANGNTLQLWDYRFNRVSDLEYAEDAQTLSKGSKWHSVVSAQYAAEDGVPDGLLAKVESHVYGAKALTGTKNVEFTLAYDKVPFVAGNYDNGAFVSPYTYNDNADPIYTTMIGDSLVDKATAGQEYDLSTTITSNDKRLKLILARGRADLPTSATVPKNELYESDADVAYDFFHFNNASPLSGLWLHERFFTQDTTIKPYQYEQSRFFVDYVF